MAKIRKEEAASNFSSLSFREKLFTRTKYLRLMMQEQSKDGKHQLLDNNPAHVTTLSPAHSQPPLIHHLQTSPFSLKMTDTGAITGVCPDESQCRPSLCQDGPARGLMAWWVKPKMLRIPHNITAMLWRVSAACYGGCHAWLLEGIFSFSLNTWHTRTVNRSLGRNRWNYLLTLTVLKMISQLTLLMYSILWEDKISIRKASLQLVSKRTSPLAFRLIYGELWQVCKLWEFPFMFTFVHLCIFLWLFLMIGRLVQPLIIWSHWQKCVQLGKTFCSPNFLLLQQTQCTMLVNSFKGKMASKISRDDITGITEKKPRWKKFITWDRFN